MRRFGSSNGSQVDGCGYPDAYQRTVAASPPARLATSEYRLFGTPFCAPRKNHWRGRKTYRLIIDRKYQGKATATIRLR